MGHAIGQNRASPGGVAAKIAAGFVAPSTILARNARAFHYARGSKPSRVYHVLAGTEGAHE